MDRSLKWRTIILAASLVLIAAALGPTFFSSHLPSWFPFKKKVVLGLDLQGGSHIVYSIALEKAVDDRASEIRRDLEARFNEEPKVKATVRTPATPVGAVTVIAPDAAKKAELEAMIKSDYGDTIESRECSDGELAICFRVSTNFAERIKRSALSQAVSTIRDRIDKTGVAEPTVVEKGDQIIVELPGLDKDVKAQTREIIARSAKLEFKVVDNNSEYMNKIYAHVGNVGKEGKPTDARAQRDEIYATVDV